MKHLVTLLAVVLFGLIISNASAQCSGYVLPGPSSVCVGSTHTYNVFGGTAGGSGCSIMSISPFGSWTGNSVTWTAAGTFTISFSCSCGIVQQTVTVTATPNTYTVGGGGSYCSGSTGPTITLSGSQTGVTYQLKVGGNTVATTSGTGGSLSWPNQTTAGTYSVTASTSCGSASMSGSAVVTVNPLPVQYTLDGGGGYCSGSPGPDITLSGSQTGVNYQLQVNGVNSGTAVAGTGNPITWPNQTSAGTYSVLATNTSTNCQLNISGPTVIVNLLPLQYMLNGGGTMCEAGAGLSISLSGSQAGVNYQLRINGVNSGAPVAGTGNALTWANQSTAGTYTVLAINATTNCEQTMSGSPQITVNPLPVQYNVGGGGTICAGETGPSVTLSGSQTGVNYQLKINSADAGTPVAGNGGALTWNNQTAAGTYTVQAIYAATGCSQTMTGQATVTVNATPNQYSLSGGGAICEGASGLTITLSGSQTGVNYQLKINGSNSGSAVAGTGSALNWPNQTTQGTYSAVATNTTSGCLRDMLNNQTIVVNSQPLQYTVSGGGAICSGEPGLTITLSGSETGVNYQLKRGSTNVGSAVAGTGNPLSWPGQTTGGTYTVMATTASANCTQTMSGSAVVTVNAAPTLYTLTGGGTICEGEPGLSVTLSGSATGTSYQLRADGNNTGPAVDGTGSALAWSNLAVSGTYSVMATITSTGCARLMTGTPTVTVIPLPVAYVSGPNAVGSSPVTLTANQCTGCTYQWRADGETVAGETSFGLSVSNPGSYEVVVTAGGSCSQTSEPHFVSLQIAPYFNGLITAMRWRTDKAYGVEGEDFKGMYAFAYDDKYQVREAQWYEPDFTLNTFSTAGNMFRTGNLRYDPNGNILSLKRFDEQGAVKHNFTYTYAYHLDPAQRKYNNQLQSVSGYTHAYTYNAIGQMIGEDKVEEGKDQYVEYDVTGKVRFVYSDAAKTQMKVEYLYDDRGFRLAKKNVESNRNTWYIRDASGNVLSIYEEDNGTLNQTEIPVYGSGKLGTVYPQEDYSTAYELTDHLGNVRALVRENVVTYTATIEDNGQPEPSNPRVEEMQYFENLFETEVNDWRMNHTAPIPGVVDNPSRAAYLYWQDGMGNEHKAIGPAIGLRVQPGDKIDLETWVRYKNKTSYARDAGLTAVASLLGNTFVNVGVFEGSTILQTSQSFAGALAAAGHGDDPDDQRPYAYLNYILFNDNIEMVDAGWQRVDAAAGFDAGEEALPNRHVRLSFSDPIFATGSGYIYIWVSNESEVTEVWFDDLKVTHTQTLVTQATDYGVWGDVLREMKAAGFTYRFGYQGQFAEKDEETGWNHFELREYDAVIGRWLVIDPYREFWSPYVAFGNSPVNIVDPRGGSTDPVVGDINNNTIWNGNEWVPLLNEVVVKPSVWNSVVDWWNSFDFVLEGSAGLDVGLRAKVHGNIWGLSANADVNVVNINLLQGNGNFADPLNADSWSGRYAGKNGDQLVSNGINVNVGVPLGGKNKISVGAYAEQSQRVHNGWSEDYESSAGINLFVPVMQNNSKNNFPGRRPDGVARAGKQKGFYGLDIGAGAQFILGADVNLKIGFSR